MEDGCAGVYVMVTPASRYAEHMGRRELDDAWRCDEVLVALDAELETNTEVIRAMRSARRLPRLLRWARSIRGN